MANIENNVSDPVLDMLESWLKARHRRTYVKVSDEGDHLHVGVHGVFSDWMVWSLVINLKKYGVRAFIPDVRRITYFSLTIPKLVENIEEAGKK